MIHLRIDGVNFPVPPEEFTTTLQNRNKVETLIAGNEINILKKPGLREFSCEIRLPDFEYSWGDWMQANASPIPSGFNEPIVYIRFLDDLKTGKKVFRLILVDDDGENVSANVTMEDLSFVRSTEWTTARCVFKKFVDYKTVVVKRNNKNVTNAISKKPKKSSYPVEKGDTLKKISKKMYGTQKYASKIYSWNKKAIETAAKKHKRKSSSKGKYIYKGTRLKLKTVK